MLGFEKEELRLLRSLSTPATTQDFLNTIPMNFHDTCYSPRTILKKRRAHCMEGAMFAAAALRLHGHKPLILDLTSAKGDDDHVVALFRIKGYWGAISKTNHAVLRYREPVYESIHELAMSYFHEYFLHNGKKTLRSFAICDLSRFDRKGWMTAEESVSYIPEYLFSIKHIPLLSSQQIENLRRADPVERKAGKIIEWKR